MKNNIKIKLTKRFLTVVAVAILLTFAVLVSGCNSLGFNPSPTDLEKTAKVAYLAEVNSITGEIKASLSDFSNIVAEQNTSAMESASNKTQEAIDKLSKLNTPDSCKEINQSYIDGYIYLQECLTNYISVFSNSKDKTLESGILNERVANAQNSYNSGVALIQKADKLANELA